MKEATLILLFLFAGAIFGLVVYVLAKDARGTLDDFWYGDDENEE